jgi:hypothetical protein
VVVYVGMIVGVAGFVLVLGFGMVLVSVGLLVVRGVVVGGGDVGYFREFCAFVDVDFCGGDSAAVDFFYLERGVEVEGGGGLVEDSGIEAGVDEGTEEHVAADAREAVEIGDAHGVIVSWVGGSGVLEYRVAQVFHVMKDGNRYRLLAFPIPSLYRPMH